MLRLSIPARRWIAVAAGALLLLCQGIAAAAACASAAPKLDAPAALGNCHQEAGDFVPNSVQATCCQPLSASATAFQSAVPSPADMPAHAADSSRPTPPSLRLAVADSVLRRNPSPSLSIRHCRLRN
jgi:hypothetical protein